MTGLSRQDEQSDSFGAGPPRAEEEVVSRLATGASAAEVAEALSLRPHQEGGFFRETYRSPLTISTDSGERCLATSILYLLTGGSPSRFHRLRSDEMWFYHAGCQAELAMLAVGGEERLGVALRAAPGSPGPLVARPPVPAQRDEPARAPVGTQPRVGTQPAVAEEPRLRLHLLGAGQPQVFVPGGWWLGARVAPEGERRKRAGETGDRAGMREMTGEERDWTLVGCVVTPGFEYEDLEMAEPESLLREFPGAADIVRALT